MSAISVEPGQVLAQLDPDNERNGLRSAESALVAAQGQLTYARNNFERQRQLLANGHTTRARFDQAQKALQNAQSAVDDATAQRQIAQDRLSYTTLAADAAGTVTARGAEPGEVVQAGQMIVRLARQGGRDAVFEVPARLLRAAPKDSEIKVRLADDPTVSATGEVREVAAQANPTTRTFEVKIALDRPALGHATRRYGYRERQTGYRPGNRDSRLCADRIRPAARRLARRSKKTDCVDAEHQSRALLSGYGYRRVVVSTPEISW